MLLLALNAFALEPTPAADPPRHSLVHYGFVPGRVNPLGAAVTARVAGRRSLQPANSGVLQRDTWIDLGLETTIAPNAVMGGPVLRVKPLAVLEMTAAVEPSHHFGFLGSLIGYDSPNVNFADRVRKIRNRTGDTQSASGVRVTLQDTLQAAVGPIAVRNITTGVFWKVGIDEPYFYEAGRDLLQPNGGWTLTNDVDTFYLAGPVITGLRYTYSDSPVGTGGPGDRATHRLGPVLVLKLRDRGAAPVPIQHLTLFTLLQWHLRHPFRAGQSTSAAIPLFALALQWDGEVTRKR